MRQGCAVGVELVQAGAVRRGDPHISASLGDAAGSVCVGLQALYAGPVSVVKLIQMVVALIDQP